jgi:hypothetical protein
MEKWIGGWPLSSIRPEMATTSARREATGTERERGEREMRASARLLHSTRQHAGVVRGDDGAWAPRGREVGARCEHGRHVQSTCRWFRHCVEYVSCVAVPDLETNFGPARV